jgi:hypothetical protein
MPVRHNAMPQPMSLPSAVQSPHRKKRSAHGITATRVEIGHADDATHAVEACCSFKLLDRFSFDPCVVRGDDRDALGQKLNAIAHIPIPLVMVTEKIRNRQAEARQCKTARKRLGDYARRSLQRVIDVCIMVISFAVG